MPERRQSGKRIQIPAAIRRSVLNSGPCAYCGEDSFSLTVDHIIPVSKGGSDARENLTPACWPCNLEKLDFTPAEWQAWRIETGKPWPPLSRSAFISQLVREAIAKRDQENQGRQAS